MERYTGIIILISVAIASGTFLIYTDSIKVDAIVEPFQASENIANLQVRQPEVTEVTPPTEAVSEILQSAEESDEISELEKKIDELEAKISSLMEKK